MHATCSWACKLYAGHNQGSLSTVHLAPKQEGRGHCHWPGQTTAGTCSRQPGQTVQSGGWWVGPPSTCRTSCQTQLVLGQRRGGQGTPRGRVPLQGPPQTNSAQKKNMHTKFGLRLLPGRHFPTKPVSTGPSQAWQPYDSTNSACPGAILSPMAYNQIP